MNKIILSMFLLLFVSGCSSDLIIIESTGNGTSSSLITNQTIIGYNGTQIANVTMYSTTGEITINNFYYNGTQIDYITENKSSVIKTYNFIYSGSNLIEVTYN